MSLPEAYRIASDDFVQQWNIGLKASEQCYRRCNEMIGILMQENHEDRDYSVRDAIKRIVSDHSHLPGISSRSIYRHLDEEHKTKLIGRQPKALPVGETISSQPASSPEQEQDETFPDEDEQPEPKPKPKAKAEVIIPAAPPSMPVDSNIHDPDRKRLEQKIDQLQRELHKAYDDIKTKNQDIAALRERIDKLESIERDRIKQDFKPATDIKSESVEILLPADKFSNLFMMSRSEKFGIWLTAQDGKVTWMEANYVRAKEAAKKK